MPEQHEDLRITPKLGEKNLSLKQMSEALDNIKLNTIEIAKSLNIKISDTANCIKKHDPNDIFYDGIHFTQYGSHKFADCISNNSI